MSTVSAIALENIMAVSQGAFRCLATRCDPYSDKWTWTRAKLGTAASAGDPILVYCNNRSGDHLTERGEQYRAVLTPADLATLAERYGDDLPFIDFRARLRCRHCGSGDVSTGVDSPYISPGER